MIKTNIKMRVTPEQSRKVQEICFENGINFCANKTNKETIEADFLYVKKDKLTYGIYEDTFKSAEYEEINADLFIKTNGTCEETYLTKYTSQPKDLESALKKIENLHIALNKKVERNKNQALEITKLLDQKKDLQDKLNQANRVVALTIDNSSDLVELIEELQKENSNLEKTIDNINLKISNIIGYPIDERCEKTAYLKAIENKLKNTNNEVVRINELNKYLKESYEIKLQEKNTIISYLESKLK